MFIPNIQATTTANNYLCMSNLGKQFGYTFIKKTERFQNEALRIITNARFLGSKRLYDRMRYSKDGVFKT